MAENRAESIGGQYSAWWMLADVTRIESYDEPRAGGRDHPCSSLRFKSRNCRSITNRIITMFMRVESEGGKENRVVCVGWPSMTARSDFQGSRPSFDRENNVLGDDMAAWPALRKQKIEQAAGQKRYRDGYV